MTTGTQKQYRPSSTTSALANVIHAAPFEQWTDVPPELAMRVGIAQIALRIAADAQPPLWLSTRRDTANQHRLQILKRVGTPPKRTAGGNQTRPKPIRGLVFSAPHNTGEGK